MRGLLNVVRAAAVAGIVFSAMAARAQEATIYPPHPLPPHPIIIVPPVRPRPMPEPVVRLQSVGASIRIEEQVATTRLEMVLRNPAGRPMEAQILLPVPDGCAMRSLQYDGSGPEPTASVLPRDEARRIYESIVSRERDPALVEFAGFNLIRTSVFPVPAFGTQRLSLTYEQVLGADGQRVDYWLPRSESLGGGDITWSVSASITSKHAVSSVFSPSHELIVTRHGPGHVDVRVADASPGQDRGSFRLSYLAGREGGNEFSTTILAYPDPELGDGGYFLMLASPPPQGAGAETQKREMTIVLDRSGSMRGEKMAQAKAALEQVLQGLEPGECFNIIDYSDTIAAFADAPVAKDKDTLARALAYVRSLQANGGTNIRDALLEALRPRPREGLVPIVLFVTDGLPTVGERDEVKLRDTIASANHFGRRIFTFGVGFDVNSPLLSGVAKASRGAPTFILPQEDVEVKVSQVFRRLKGPMLCEPRLASRDPGGMARVREVLPNQLPDIFEGDQLIVLGQYTGREPITLRVTGQSRGRDAGFTAAFDPGMATVRHSYVPRLWASSKIAGLIEQIRQGGAGGTPDPRSRELIDEVVRLSTKFGILTEYTAFLATEPGVRFDPANRPGLIGAAGRAIERRAVRDRDGAGGVNQEENIAKMAAPAAASPAQSTWYYDEKMERKQLTALQNIADRTLFKREQRWVDSQLLAQEHEAPQQTIEFGTREYMDVVARLAATQRQGLLAMGGEVYLLLDGQRVLVKGP